MITSHVLLTEVHLQHVVVTRMHTMKCFICLTMFTNIIEYIMKVLKINLLQHVQVLHKQDKLINIYEEQK